METPAKGGWQRVLPRDGWLWGASGQAEYPCTEAAVLSQSDGGHCGKKKGITRCRDQTRVARWGNAKPASSLESDDILGALGLSQADPCVPSQKLNVQTSHKAVLQKSETSEKDF